VDGLLLEAQERQLLLDVLLLSSDQSVSPSHESLGQIATYCLVVDSTASADQADRQSHQAIRLDTAATCQSQPDSERDARDMIADVRTVYGR